MAYSLQPVPHLSTIPPQRYESYVPRGRAPNLNWLEELNIWEGRASANVVWQDHSERGEGNRAIHTSTPVVTCTLYHFPDEHTQQYFRRASHDHRIAVEDSRQAVSLWLQQQNQPAGDGHGRKVLTSLYYTVYYDPRAGSHAQYIVDNINYTYRLDNWTAKDCAHRDNNKADARRGAVQMLMQKERGYCMIPLNH